MKPTLMKPNPAFDNRREFSARGDGKPFVISFRAKVEVSNPPDSDVIPMFIGGSDFFGSGYEAMLRNMALVTPSTGLAVTNQIIAGDAFTTANNHTKVNFTFVTDTFTTASLSCVNMNVWDFIAYLKTNLLLLSNIRFNFMVAAGSHNEAIDQLRQSVYAFTSDIAGKNKFDSVTMMDYFKPDNKGGQNNEAVGGLYSIDIPAQYILSSSSCIGFGMLFQIFSKPPNSMQIDLTVEKCFMHDQQNFKSL